LGHGLFIQKEELPGKQGKAGVGIFLRMPAIRVRIITPEFVRTNIHHLNETFSIQFVAAAPRISAGLMPAAADAMLSAAPGQHGVPFNTRPTEERPMSTAPITWFEIPTRDIDAAQRFYEQLLGKALRRETIGEALMAVFDAPDDTVGGALIDAPGMGPPQAQGTLVYLDAGPSLQATLARAAALGGRVTTPCTALPPGLGYFAHIIDTEGNRVGLHALA
jgi:uncharacterized protein